MFDQINLWPLGTTDYHQVSPMQEANTVHKTDRFLRALDMIWQQHGIIVVHETRKISRGKIWGRLCDCVSSHDLGLVLFLNHEWFLTWVVRLSSSVLTISLTAKLLAWNWFWSTLWNKRDLHWKTSWEKFWWRSQPKFCEKILTNAEQCVASLEMGPHFMTNKSSDWFGSGLALWPKFQINLLQMPTLRFEWSLQTQWPVLWQCAASRWMQFGMNERGLFDRL